MHEQSTLPVLVADDDLDDCLLIQEAFRETRASTPLHFVHNGVELLDYLKRRAPYTDSRRYPRPGLILLDLNMPLMDGREALTAIKSDPELRMMPVVVLTTSAAQEDIRRCYASGVNAFVSKPTSFSELVDQMQTLGHHWLDLVALPDDAPSP
ncbi:MAG: response regulator [Pseudomonas sp.]|uniref:response regulator n=1 Tax=Pseudomonas sp. TaxID=306 RepID=UPI0033970212